MSSIEEARNIRVEFKHLIVGKGFTQPQSERLTGIEVLGSSGNLPESLLPYGIIDPGRMTSNEFREILKDFPDLLPDYQWYCQGSPKKGRFRITSTFTELVPIDADEIYTVQNIMFQKEPGKFEIR